MIKYGHPPRGDAGFSVRLSIFWIFFVGGNMKKLIKIIIVLLVLIALSFLGYFGYQKYQEYKEAERIRNAIIKVELINPLEVEIDSDVKLSDLITSINGVLIDDFKIDTSGLGVQEIDFKYINEEEIKVPYHFSLNIKDTTPPVIWLGESYTITVGYKKNLVDEIMSGDIVDDIITRKIIGEYNVNRVGNYNLVYEATDQSGNTARQEFVLKVVKKKKTSNPTTIPYKSLYNEYKKNDTTVGLDVSKWQGNINFDKIKNENVDFVYIKIGGQNGVGKDYYLDPKFKNNIEGFTKIGVPVGLYFYSYADSVEEAENEALWIVDQIKDYKIDLPIAFDWESWSSFNKCNISFKTLTKMAEAFSNVLEKNGYKGMLYSSKNYLEKVWQKTNLDIWLAHYTSNTTYEGTYKCWQRTSSAKILGISGNTVDVNICYN